MTKNFGLLDSAAAFGRLGRARVLGQSRIFRGAVLSDRSCTHRKRVSVGWRSSCLGLAPLGRGFAMLNALLSRAVSSSPFPELHLFVRLWRRGDDPPEHLLELFHGHG